MVFGIFGPLVIFRSSGFGLLDQLVSFSFRDPSGSELGSKIDEYLQDMLKDLTNTTSDLTLNEILDHCSNGTDGQGIYFLLHLDQLYNVTELKDWRTKFNIDPVITDMQKTIEVILFYTE